MCLFWYEYHTFLITIALFVVYFEIRKHDISSFVLLSQNCYGYLGSFVDFLLVGGDELRVFIYCHLELEPRVFAGLPYILIVVTLNIYTENIDNLKIGNLVIVGNEKGAIFISRNWFIYLLDIFFRVPLRDFGEMI